MRIAKIPDVLFDEFPSDESTKLCIFTQPIYPVPDLSNFGDGLVIFCTETAIRVYSQMKKKLPMKLLPDKDGQWVRFTGDNVKGLSTPFAVTCLPTGNIVGSVMLFLTMLDNLREIHLYTGTFSSCNNILTNDTFMKYHHMVSDVYLDNEYAASKHIHHEQNRLACDAIKNIHQKFPNKEIRLQMNVFETLELLVELARNGSFNVRLALIQQIVFRKAPEHIRSLFEYNETFFPDGKELNKHFRLQNCPKIYIDVYDSNTLDEYKSKFQSEDIVNIKLIPSEHHNSATIHGDKELFYVSHTAHAGVFTLSSLFKLINPKRVHPMTECHPSQYSISKIPPEILNEGCKIVRTTEKDCSSQEVRFNRDTSFLDLSSLQSDVSSSRSGFLNLTPLMFEPDACSSNQSDEENNDRSSNGKEIRKGANTKNTNKTVEQETEEIIIEIDTESGSEIIILSDTDSGSDILEMFEPYKKREKQRKSVEESELSAKRLKLNENNNTPECNK